MRKVIKRLCNRHLNFFLFAASVFLFFSSHPNFLFSNGLSFLAWFAYVPVFLLVDRVNWRLASLYGFLYGVCTYLLYGIWLLSYSLTALVAVCIYYGILLTIVFLFLKSTTYFFQKYNWLIKWMVFCSYEYLKTLGLLGFSYGITGYTQWKNGPLVHCASLAGVWGVSALVIFSSALLSSVVQNLQKNKNLVLVFKSEWKGCCFFFIFLTAFLFCGTRNSIITKSHNIRVTLIQGNSDPWENSINSYFNDIMTLEHLTDEALVSFPDTAVVVWPETAVVPSIVLHYQNRDDRNRYELVKQLLEYMQSKKCVFVIGNDHAVQSGNSRKDYNSALVFDHNSSFFPPDPDIYSKIHLVPFAEYFPWESRFPKLYKYVLNGDTHMWSPGTNVKIFNFAGISFSTPICFEDTFDKITREMCNKGARLFINLSNDSWSKSLSCQKQHLSMAVFRSAENGIPSVRSTSSGQTCIIDSNGCILKEAVPFEATWISDLIPISVKDFHSTFYGQHGDFLPVLIICLFCILFLIQIIKKIFMYWKKN